MKVRLVLVIAILPMIVSCQQVVKNIEVNEAPPIPIALAGHAGGLVEGCVVVAGGNNWSTDRTKKNWLKDSFIFHAGQWITGPPLPNPTADVFFAYDDSGLYVAGGNNEIAQYNKVYRLSEIGQNAFWQPFSILPYSMTKGCGTILNGNFYISCGYVGKDLSNQLWSLDITDPDAKWQQRQSLPGAARVYPALVACGDYLYLLGRIIFHKENPSLTVLKDTYRYNSKTNEWKRLPDLPFTGYAWSGTAVDDKHILLTARAFENSNISSDIWLVNVDNMTTTKVGNTVIQVCSAPLVKVDNKTWWLIGGEPDATRNRTPRVTVINLE